MKLDNPIATVRTGRTHRLAGCAAVALMGASVLVGILAPTASATTPTTVSGTANGAGAGVCVYAIENGSGNLVETVTVSGGTYTINDVPSGTYVVQFDPSCDGANTATLAGAYYDGSTGAPTLGGATPVTVAGTPISGISVTLTTGATLQGTISGGADACVDAFDPTDFWNYETQADDNGQYSLPGLTFDSYYIEFDPTCGDFTANTSNAPVFYPTAADQDGAQLVALSSPTPLTEDATLPIGGTISGAVVGMNGVPATNVCVDLFSTDPDGSYNYSTETGPAGTYSFTGLAAVSFNVVYDPTCNGVQASDYVASFADGTQVGTPVAVSPGATSAVNGTLVSAGGNFTVGPSSGAAGTVGSFYSLTLATGAGIAPFSWSASGLPAGLSINPTSGVVSGTPTAAGSSSATITATDSSAQPVATVETIGFTVNPAAVSTTATTVPVVTTTVAPVAPRRDSVKPKATLATTTLVLADGDSAPVTVTCAAATCSGSIKLVQLSTVKVPYTVKHGKKTVTEYRVKTTTLVLGAATFKLHKGKKATEKIVLNAVGKRIVARASVKSPLHESVTTSTKGGKTTTKSVVVV